jgi:hypothetical protein
MSRMQVMGFGRQSICAEISAWIRQHGLHNMIKVVPSKSYIQIQKPIGATDYYHITMTRSDYS